MSDDKDLELARKRAEVIFAVRSGQITAEEGARRLGVSRKTYYEWENRALEAMTGALEDRASGRPGTPKDEERERLQNEIAALQNELFVARDGSVVPARIRTSGDSLTFDDALTYGGSVRVSPNHVILGTDTFARAVEPPPPAAPA